MELLIRFIQIMVYLLEKILRPCIIFVCRIKQQKLPPFDKNDMLLNLSATILTKKILSQEIKSVDLVKAYIKRIKAVNPIVNAVIEDRFKDAIVDAERCDALCLNSSDLDDLGQKFPLLGIPFTVKESCGVKGLSQVVGSLYRLGIKAENDGLAVKSIRCSGAIPLLVSSNPEFCVSWETISLVHGRTNNPYDVTKSSGGSSGGEGALNGAGASLFGLGSDLCGSIRIPAAFNGIFGHKPTGSLVPVLGHFPMINEKSLSNLLQMGPITRFAEDLSLIMKVLISTEYNELMKFDVEIPIQELKIFYLEDLTKSIPKNWTSLPIDEDIKKCMIKALNYLNCIGCSVSTINFKEFENSPEICAVTLLEYSDPKILENPETHIESTVVYELFRPLFGERRHSFHGIFFQLLHDASGLVTKSRLADYKSQREELKNKLQNLLGNNGVLIYPTFPRPAYPHYTSPIYSIETSFPGIFNMIGFPATHVPMGLNDDGLPIGLQVIAAPYQDKLCFQIAVELEKKFGGWVPPSLT